MQNCSRNQPKSKRIIPVVASETASGGEEKNSDSATGLAHEKISFPDEDDEDALDTGKQVFMSKCMACHGAKGEGLVGPNFTDDYWIHGKGTLEDMYKTVIEGVPEKGMISWAPVLSDEEIKAVVVYVKSLQGTNPENPKAPQGEKVG